MAIKPQHGWSLSSVFADSVNVNDIHEGGFQELYGERMEVYVPEPSKQDRKSYGMAVRGEWDNGSRAADEWRDANFPIMNALWPVDLAYGRSHQEATRLIGKHGGATVLITIDDRDFIAMTGGGMDLSWHIASAYVCCGCVPPVQILEGLYRSPFETSKSARAAVLSAWRDGAKFLRDKARRLNVERQCYAKKKDA